MKIGFLSLSDAEYGGEWSGTTKNIFLKLKNKYEIEKIDLSKNFVWKLINLLEKIRYRISKNRGILPMYISKYYARQFEKKIVLHKVDCLVVPVGSVFLSNLHTDLPIIYLSDATFSLLNNYYYFDVSKRQQYLGNLYESLSLEKARVIIESSEWAKLSVINDYSITEEKVNTISFGANLPDLYENRSIKEKLSTNINILFIGVDYERKGVKKAIEIVEYINSQNDGMCNLHLVGISDEYNEESEHVFFHGKLRKDVKIEFDKLIELFNSSTIFILPTVADATPIVFAEACQFGLPIISHNTGGISTFVKEGINGHLFSLQSTPVEVGEKILELLNDKEKLQRFSKQARIMYEEEFNWGSWLKSFDNIIRNMGDKTDE